MSKVIICFGICILTIVACQNTKTIKLRAPHTIEGVVLGDSVLDNNVKDAATLVALLAPDDFVKANLAGKVEAVSKDSTWIKLLDDKTKSVIISAKDNAFSFPKSIVGKEIIVYGEARLRNLSVATQKANVFAEEINIENATDSLRTKEVVFFEATGLVVPKK